MMRRAAPLLLCTTLFSTPRRPSAGPTSEPTTICFPRARAGKPHSLPGRCSRTAAAHGRYTSPTAPPWLLCWSSTAPTSTPPASTGARLSWMLAARARLPWCAPCARAAQTPTFSTSPAGCVRSGTPSRVRASNHSRRPRTRTNGGAGRWATRRSSGCGAGAPIPPASTRHTGASMTLSRVRARSGSGARAGVTSRAKRSLARS
mmetsp:Transcript_29558/g.98048  ORF Transcript_29558/g.98048 Transcript_29558/m.98048 type:complete len:204 (-) Transcript_29558:193-804(-)